ncbi:hypothetical protein [Stenotrophomonas bentonitica]
MSNSKNEDKKNPTNTPAPSQRPEPTPTPTPSSTTGSSEEDKRTLAELEKEELELQAKIARLGELKKNKMTADAESVFEQLKDNAIKFRDFITSDKKQELISAILGPQEEIPAGKGGKGGKGGKNVKKDKGPVEQKYEVNGRTWSGRGKAPREFMEWLDTAEGKQYQKQHKTGDKNVFPPIKK